MDTNKSALNSKADLIEQTAFLVCHYSRNISSQAWITLQLLEAKSQEAGSSFLCVYRQNEREIENLIFIQYIQASTQTQMILSSAEWERCYLRWDRLKILLSDSMTEIITLKWENSKLSPRVDGDSFWSFRIAGFCLRLHFYRNTF